MLRDSRRVEWAADAACTVAQDVGVDHRRGDVPVARELLHGPDVVPSFEQMCGKGMAEGMTRHPLSDPRCLRRIGRCYVSRNALCAWLTASRITRYMTAGRTQERRAGCPDWSWAS